MKFHFKWHQMWKSNDAGACQRGEIDKSHRDCDKVSDNESEKDGQLLPVGLCKYIK